MWQTPRWYRGRIVAGCFATWCCTSASPRRVGRSFLDRFETTRSDWYSYLVQTGHGTESDPVGVSGRRPVTRVRCPYRG